MSRKRIPGRQTRPAYSTKRRSWYGLGKLATLEKNAYGRFLHDVVYVFSEVAILGLPVLLAIAMTDASGYYGVTAGAMVAWITMVAIGALIRGGWIRPFATETLGWVTFTPTLLFLRVIYYNFVLFLSGYGATALASAVGLAPLSLVLAAAIAVLAALSFPRLGESVARWRTASRVTHPPDEWL